MDGIQKWLAGWKRNGWKTAAKKPVKNVELWQRLDAAIAPHQADWQWVKGHAGHTENERCDQLASQKPAAASPALCRQIKALRANALHLILQMRPALL